MELKTLGEFGLIASIQKRFEKPHSQNIVCGIGDDCAVLKVGFGQAQLLTTDTLVENIHFQQALITPYQLGAKALVANLSDIAAMGGQPDVVLLSLSLTSDIDTDWLDGFLEGFQKTATDYQVSLVGGDMCHTDKNIVISITVLGSMPLKQVRYRSMAKIGDAICVTSTLGDAAAGLRMLRKPIPHPSFDVKTLIKAHQEPRAYVEEGRWLSKQTSVHAMMDISDGLASDLKHLTQQSQVGANVSLDKVPISKALKGTMPLNQWSAESLALTGGEDYCLLFSVDAKQVDRLKKAYEKQFQQPFYVMGTMTDTKEIQYVLDDHPIDLDIHGYDHFV